MYSVIRSGQLYNKALIDFERKTKTPMSKTIKLFVSWISTNSIAVILLKAELQMVALLSAGCVTATQQLSNTQV